MDEAGFGGEAEASIRRQPLLEQNVGEDGVVAVGEDSDGKITATTNAGETVIKDEGASDSPTMTEAEERKFVFDVQRTQQRFLINEQEMQTLLQQYESLLQTNNQGSSEISNDSISEVLEMFDLYYEELLSTLDDLAQDLNRFPEDKIGETVLDNLLEIMTRVEGIRRKKDILFVKNSKASPIIEASSTTAIDNAIIQLAENGDFTPESLTEIKTKIQQIEEYAGMTLDSFVELNEGSNLETFLQFLYDPVHSRGRDGNTFKFGKFDNDDSQSAELIPLPIFRALFAESRGVGKALAIAAKEINPEWANSSSNRGDLETLKDSDNPALLKKVLLELYQSQMNSGDKREEKIHLFKLHFGTALITGEPVMNKDSDGYLNSSSFLYFVDMMQNEGNKLDKLWDIEN